MFPAGNLELLELYLNSPPVPGWVGYRQAYRITAGLFLVHKSTWWYLCKGPLWEFKKIIGYEALSRHRAEDCGCCCCWPCDTSARKSWKSCQPAALPLQSVLVTCAQECPHEGESAPWVRIIVLIHLILHIRLLFVFRWYVLPDFSVYAHMIDFFKSQWSVLFSHLCCIHVCVWKRKTGSILCFWVRLLLKSFWTR